MGAMVVTVNTVVKRQEGIELILHKHKQASGFHASLVGDLCA